jgi:hypothetical protein
MHGLDPSCFRFWGDVVGMPESQVVSNVAQWAPQEIENWWLPFGCPFLSMPFYTQCMVRVQFSWLKMCFLSALLHFSLRNETCSSSFFDKVFKPIMLFKINKFIIIIIIIVIIILWGHKILKPRQMVKFLLYEHISHWGKIKLKN